MKFQLEIELGNDAMQTGTDIAHALRKAAESIESAHILNRDVPVEDWDDYDKAGHIRDLNGNTVGKWEVVDK